MFTVQLCYKDINDSIIKKVAGIGEIRELINFSLTMNVLRKGNFVKKKKTLIYICIIQLVILAIVFCVLLINRSTNRYIDVDLSQWKSAFVQYENNKWAIDEGTIEGENTIDFLYGPYMHLPKGHYTINIWYECDSNQSFQPFANSGKSFFIKAGTALLNKNQTFTEYQFVTTEDLDNFEVVVKYNGKGHLQINKIEISKNTNGIEKIFLILFVLFPVGDFIYLYYEKIKEHKVLLFTLLGISLCASLPLFMRGVHWGHGHDIGFHLMRIEGISKELARGNIPVRLSSLWMDGYGYPVSIYYADILLYIPAILRNVGFSLIGCYKTYIFLINVGTTIISYICFKKMFIHSRIAVITTFAYVTTSYRFVNIYVRSAVGEYSSMMFLPVVAVAIYLIYTENDKEWKKYKKNALLLALGMTGIIGCHVLTVEMVCFVLVVVCIALWKKTIRKNTLKVYGIAILQALLLNAYFIIPFLDYYLNVPVRINDIVDGESVKMIQDHGTYIAQYFSFFQNPFGVSTTAINYRMGLTPGIVLIFALIIAVVLWAKGKANKEIKIVTVFSLFMLFVASNMFPWNHIAFNFELGDLLAQVQFPWRYIGIANLFLSILLGLVLKQYKIQENGCYKNIAGVMNVLSIIFALVFLGYYCDNANLVNYYDTAEISTYNVVNGEYVRSGTELDLLTNKIATENLQGASIISRDGSNMQIHCIAGNEEGRVEVPLFNYKGYIAVDDYGNEYTIKDGMNNVISIDIPSHFEGNITISFVEPFYWRIAEVISICMVLVSILYVRYKKKSF